MWCTCGIIFNSSAMSNGREQAYRYDLFITPDWRDRFDTLINEKIDLPREGRILDVNCGTGAHAIELSERVKSNGEVIGIDPAAERIEIARAKAQAKETPNVRFEQGIASDLPFESHAFDVVIGDASMLAGDEVEQVLGEMVRVAVPEGRVILKLTTYGSFGEFFSIYWEALYDAGIDGEVWAALERLIDQRLKVTDAEHIAGISGLRKVESFISKEEFGYLTGEDFLESPLINDCFLPQWLEIIPEESRGDIRQRIAAIVDRERHDAAFDVSIKATLITGVK